MPAHSLGRDCGAMTRSGTDQFFETLAATGHATLLEKASGSVRFDVTHGEQTEHWMVIVNKGDVRVTRDEADADSVVHISRETLDRLATGEMNAFSALLRGQFIAEGNLELPVLLQRLLPGPPKHRPPRPEAAPTPPPGATAMAGAHAGAGTGPATDGGRS